MTQTSGSRPEQSIVRHGTMNGYNHDGCRCILCRAAKAKWYRDTGANIRVGKRADQKRSADTKRAAARRGSGS